MTGIQTAALAVRGTLRVADPARLAVGAAAAAAKSIPLPAPAHVRQGAAAIELLGSAPLAPTGAVADALAAGRLLRSGSDEALDAAEQLLRHGTIDRTNVRFLGGANLNGRLAVVRIDDATPGAARASIEAVEKTSMQQAAQEEFGYRLARALGLDDYVPVVARRADGTARIELRSGTSLSAAKITDSASLEHALAYSYLQDPALRLSAVEAAQAARIDRQLIQTFDYLLANNDRHLANGLFDAAKGARLSLIDHGHTGRGALSASGGSTLEPALRGLQPSHSGGRVELDPVVIEYLRSRLDAQGMRTLHASVFQAPGIAPTTGVVGAADEFAARLQHVLDTGGYTSRTYQGDGLGMALQSHDPMRNPRGLGNVRRMFDQL